MLYAVRIDTPSTTAPLTINTPVHAIHDAHGALTGFLVRNGQRIERVDASFANPVTMFTLGGPDLRSLAHAGVQENTWNFSSGGKVHAFDASGDAGAPDLVLTLASGETGEQALATDTQESFIAVRTGTASMRVMRYELATRTTGTAGSADYGRMHLTPTRVVLRDLLNGAVATFPRAGGDTQEIMAPSPLAGDGSVTVAGERIWLHFRSARKVVSVMSDGRDALNFPGAVQAGCAIDWRNACDSILVVDGNHLKAFDGSSGAFQRDYGSLPAKHAGKLNMITLTPHVVPGYGAVLTVMDQESFMQFPLSSYLFIAGQTGLIPLSAP